MDLGQSEITGKLAISGSLIKYHLAHSILFDFGFSDLINTLSMTPWYKPRPILLLDRESGEIMSLDEWLYDQQKTMQ